jgi:hypothetical protein
MSLTWTDGCNGVQEDSGQKYSSAGGELDDAPEIPEYQMPPTHMVEAAKRSYGHSAPAGVRPRPLGHVDRLRPQVESSAGPHPRKNALESRFGRENGVGVDAGKTTRVGGEG